VIEVAQSDEGLQEYLVGAFKTMLSNSQFELALPGHVSDGAITMQRVRVVLDRIQNIVARSPISHR
jgi:hypothetical protein